MTRVFSFLLALLATITADAAVFNQFAPATGILKGSATSYITTPAVWLDVSGLLSGTCNSTTYVRGDGSCQPAVTSVAMTVPAFLSVSGSPITTSGTLAVTLSGTALPVANGGTGTATPNIVAGTGISVSGTWPNQTINTTSGVTGLANPSAPIGLTAVNGSATTALRSDGAPALSQAISPTWTGAHLYSGGVTVGGTGQVLAGATRLGIDTTAGVSRFYAYGADATTSGSYEFHTLESDGGGDANRVQISGAGNLQINGGSALTLNNATNNTTSSVYNTATTGQSNVVLRTGGVDRVEVTNGGNVTHTDPGGGYTFSNAAGGNLNLGLLAGTGSAQAYVYNRANSPLLFGTNNTTRASISAAGNVTINAPSSGASLTLDGTAATLSNTLNATGTTTGGNYFNINNTGGTTYLGTERSAGGILFSGTPAYASVFGSASSTDVSIASNGSERVRITPSGNVTINAPGSGSALTVSGPSAASGYAIQAIAGAGAAAREVAIFGHSGVSNGLRIISGGTAGAMGYDFAAGNVTINAPSSGTALTVNSAAAGTPALNLVSGTLALAGSEGTAGQVLTSGGASAAPTWSGVSTSSSFTCGWTGFSANPSTTVNYTITGRMVIIRFPNSSGTSNAVTWTMTSLPAAITPSANQNIQLVGAADNGTIVPNAFARVTTGSTIEFYPDQSSSGWTNSGTKGFTASGSSVFVYTLD